MENKLEKMNKKGIINFADTPTIVIALVVIGIFLAVGALIMTEFNVTQTETFSSTVVNETHAGTTAPSQNITLDNSGQRQFTVNCATVVVTNATGSGFPALPPGSNVTCLDSSYTKNATAPVFTNLILINDTYGSTLNITYSFTATDQNTFFNASQETLQGLDTLASFQTIIAVVVAAAVILGVIFLIRQ